MGVDAVVPSVLADLELTARLKTGQTLIDEMDLQTKTALQLTREAMYALAPVFLAVIHIEWQSDHCGIRLPVANDGFDPFPVGALPLGTNRL